jgi:hypothetical protein
MTMGFVFAKESNGRVVCTGVLDYWMMYCTCDCLTFSIGMYIYFNISLSLITVAHVHSTQNPYYLGTSRTELYTKSSYSEYYGAR